MKQATAAEDFDFHTSMTSVGFEPTIAAGEQP